MTADSNADASLSGVRVYWWRDQRLDTEVPRSHGIGWASSDGRRYGALALRSDSRVLTDEQLEPLAAAELADQPGLGLDVRLSSVRRRWTQAGAAVRILAEGGQIVDADLRAHYGTTTLFGVTCDLHPGAHGAATPWVVVDSAVSTSQRAGLLERAEATIREFCTSSEAGLIEHGWSLSSGRWQLLVHDDAAGGTPCYGAVATLLGPLREDDAGSIVERLREFAASLQPHQHETQTRVEVHFTLRAASRREAVMRALSLSDDLGYRLMHLDVFRLEAPEPDSPRR